MEKRKEIIISGKTEEEIIKQIIDSYDENHIDDLKECLTVFEESTGLDSLKENMKKFFDIIV